MQYPDFTPMSQDLQQLFRTVAEQTAQLTAWMKRRSKLTGPLFFQTLILGWMDQPEASLNDLALFCHKINPQLQVSPQALDQRINPEAVQFFRRMLAESLSRLKEKYLLEIHLLNAFSHIYLLDSTTISLPDSLKEVFPGSGGDAAASGLKVQLLLEFLSGRYRLLEVKPATAPDQSYGPQILSALQPESLTLMDTGYFNAPFFSAIAERPAYFLSRLPANIAIFESLARQQGEALDLDRLLTQAAATPFEMEAVICGGHPLACRLIFLPVAPEVAAERRRRAKAKARRQGRQIRPATLQRLDWSIFTTNVSTSLLSAQTIATVFRLRWAVELTFKLWKSYAQLNRVAGKRPERVLCEFYAKLIGLVVFTLVAAPARVLATRDPQRELSLPKAIKIFRGLAQQLPGSLANWEGLVTWLKEQIQSMLQYGLKQRRWKHPSTWRRLQLEVSKNKRSYRLERPIQFLQQGKGKCTVPQFRSYLKAVPVNPLQALPKTA
jgi:hypothetical protein